MRRALPDAWTFATPSSVLRARLDGAGAALERLLTDTTLDSDDLCAAATLAWKAAEHADTAGRVLGAANQALPAPVEPHLRLWQAATTLREHRGDGHVAALVAHGVSPVQAHLLKAAADETDMELLRQGRKWMTPTGSPAPRPCASGAGRRLGPPDHRGRARAGPVRATDRRGGGRSRWRALGDELTTTLARLLRPLARATRVWHVSGREPIGLRRPPSGEDNLEPSLSAASARHRSG